MKQSKRRGFTIVELVIVIAVIAVLAAVLIPTFSSLIKKAKFSNDIGLVSQMNTMLTVDEAVDGKNMTFHGAREDLLENGIDLTKLQTNSENHRFAWDSKENRIVLLDGESVIVAPEGYSGENKNLFVVAKEKSDIIAGDLNYYLADEFEVEGDALNVAVGIDVGNNADININYESSNSETRMFNTNGGTLTLNNSNATVEHYGEAANVVVTAVASESYHCHAAVGSINVTKGRVVVESDAEVSTVNVSGAEAKVDVKKNNADIPVLVESGVGLSEGAITGSAQQIEVDNTKPFCSTYLNGMTDEDINTAFSAHENATDYTLIMLKDLSFQSSWPNKIYGKDVVINLNGHTLAFTAQMVGDEYVLPGENKNYISGGTCVTVGTAGEHQLNLKIMNGTIECINITQANLFFVSAGSKLTLEDVKIKTTWTDALKEKLVEFAGGAGHSWDEKLGACTMINVNGNGATLNMINSSIKSEFTYGVGTNASEEDNYNVQVSLDRSEISALCGILCNIPSTLNITNGSKVTGAMQGIVLKGGSAEISDSEISFYSTDTAENLKGNLDHFNTRAWGGGNTCNLAALTVGNKNASGYLYPISVNLTNVKFTSHAENGTETAPLIYAWAKNDPNCATTITYSGCTFEGGNLVFGGTPVTALGSDNYGLTYLTVNGQKFESPTTFNPEQAMAAQNK